MISKLLSNTRRTRQVLLCLTTLVGLAGLAAAPSARAVTTIEPASVVPGDTFSFDVIGYNRADPGDDVYLIRPGLTSTFGMTTPYNGDTLDGQTLTVSSTEFKSGNTISDFISISVPSNFVPTGTKDNANNTIDSIQFSIGNYLGGNDPLDLNSAISSYNVTGTVTFQFNGATTSGSVPMTSTLTNGTAFSTFGVVFATPQGADISNSKITGFSIDLTYSTVPEPSTYAAVALGLGGLLLVVRRRRARA